MFEFLCPDKSPPNARMPKRKKAKNLQKEQPTRTPHPHNKIHPEVSTNTPRSFANTTIAHSKFLMCIDAKFPPTQQSTPKFRNVQKSKVSDYLKRPSKFPPTQQSTPKFHNALKSEVSDYLKRPSKFPPTQQSTPKFRNMPKSKVSGYLKHPSKFPYTHEVREFLTIQRPPKAPDQTPTPHPRSILGSLIASKIRYLSREKFTPWGLDRPPPAPPRTGGNPSVCVPKNA